MSEIAYFRLLAYRYVWRYGCRRTGDQGGLTMPQVDLTEVGEPQLYYLSNQKSKG
jgi:hypothetical protein